MTYLKVTKIERNERGEITLHIEGTIDVVTVTLRFDTDEAKEDAIKLLEAPINE